MYQEKKAMMPVFASTPGKNKHHPTAITVPVDPTIYKCRPLVSFLLTQTEPGGLTCIVKGRGLKWRSASSWHLASRTHQSVVLSTLPQVQRRPLHNPNPNVPGEGGCYARSALLLKNVVEWFKLSCHLKPCAAYAIGNKRARRTRWRPVCHRTFTLRPQHVHDHHVWRSRRAKSFAPPACCEAKMPIDMTRVFSISHGLLAARNPATRLRGIAS